MIVMSDDKPPIRALVAYELRPDVFTDAAVVSLELAAELCQKGYVVLVDPADEADLASWERLQRSRGYKRKWYGRSS